MIKLVFVIIVLVLIAIAVNKIMENGLSKTLDDAGEFASRKVDEFSVRIEEFLKQLKK